MKLVSALASQWNAHSTLSLCFCTIYVCDHGLDDVAVNHCRVFQSQYPCAEWRSGSHVTEICSPLKSIENMKPTFRPLSRSKTPRPFESCASSAPPAIERPALTAE